MRYHHIFWLLFLLVSGCIEPYNFKVETETRSLVVEAFITDKSFVDTRGYPSDGRYFKARVTYSGDVTNERPTPVQGVVVFVEDDQGASWQYIETEPGTYVLADDVFHALPERKYRLTVQTGAEVYQSSWEQLPAARTPVMGDIGFTETEKDVFEVEANETVIRTKKGIEPHVHVSPNTSGESLYYRWEYEPMWIYAAPLAPRSSGLCWVTGFPWYLNEYELQVDNVGGYDKPLFFIETVRNEKLFEQFSLLVKQYVMDDDYYFFWKEMKDRATGVGINEVPPFNLKSNYTSSNPDKKVFGYFGVAQEQARRWYFSTKDLSYKVENTLKADCLVDYGPGGPAPECRYCESYGDGDPTTVRPTWWQN